MSTDEKKIKNQAEKIIRTYTFLVSNIAAKAKKTKGRASGGVIRAAKGELVESMARCIVDMAWMSLGGKAKRLNIKREKIKIPMDQKYIAKIKNHQVQQYIRKHIEKYYYPASVDLHVYVDSKFVLGVECKAYAENAMMKRILIDFALIKRKYPNLNCVLFQLESQLGGDYSELKDVAFGSFSTHTLLSFFDVNLYILTLLKGERKVDKPIHETKYFKQLTDENICKAMNVLQELLKKHI